MSDDGETMLRLTDDDDRAIALIGAIHAGDIARLRSMLDDDPRLASCRIVDGKHSARTLLHVVADWPGHFPGGALTVATLAAAGSDVDAAVRPRARRTGHVLRPPVD